MKDKKGLEMATGTIVTIVLGLVILVILIIFVQQQVKRSSEKYEQFGQEAEISVGKCQSIVLGRFCAASCTSTDPKAKYEAVPIPPGGWTDCGKVKGLEGKGTCCKNA